MYTWCISSLSFHAILLHSRLTTYCIHLHSVFSTCLSLPSTLPYYYGFLYSLLHPLLFLPCPRIFSPPFTFSAYLVTLSSTSFNLSPSPTPIHPTPHLTLSLFLSESSVIPFTTLCWWWWWCNSCFVTRMLDQFLFLLANDVFPATIELYRLNSIMFMSAFSLCDVVMINDGYFACLACHFVLN